eukprot:TRINITY_DN9356_c0_g1_i3.p2 TRINITY_DN9356_c0_g1~~TRINITY_DN9356_c0_g1_i3.p2  ORF type:complete len:489 (-),score=30.53 TRINITY_DN9356_c0_g1_i3:237-1703(-)
MMKYSKNQFYNSNLSKSNCDSMDSSINTNCSPELQQVVSTPTQRKQPFFIGVSGGTASGKTTVCDQIMQRLHDQCVEIIQQDSFYRGLTPDELENVTEYNFDHPDAFDQESLLQCLQKLQMFEGTDIPIYDFSRHQQTGSTRRVQPADVIILEGILVLHMHQIRSMLNMCIFVDTDDDVRLARRIQRDVEKRGRDVKGVIEQYTKFVKPMFDRFVAPSRRHADVIIPWQNGHNLVAIDLITEHIRTKLQQHDLVRLYNNLQLVPSNYQIRGMHTIMRDRNTNKNDFVFYADRLIRLVVEAGLGHLPFKRKDVITPTGRVFAGVEFAKKLCGVSVIRSGEAMENALRACCKGIKIGKILVMRRHVSGQDNFSNHQGRRHTISNEQGFGQDELVYEKLPADIALRHVLLMDPILGTGNTACRAIRVLLDKGVEEDRILFLSLIAAPEGIQKVCKLHPKVIVITSEIDMGIDDNYKVIPGIGEFGDRYFCE